MGILGVLMVRAIFICLAIFSFGSSYGEWELTLEEAETIALSTNRDICTLSNLLERAKQGRLESLSKWWPEVYLISRGYKTEKKQAITNTKSAFISQFGLVQSLFSTDRYYNVKIAGLVVEQLKLLLDAMIIDVLYDVRVAYYKVIYDVLAVNIAKQAIEIFDVLAKREESNFRIGTTILLTLNQSKVAIANATSVYYQALRNLEVDKDVLVTALGYDAGSFLFEPDDIHFPLEEIPLIGEKLSKVEGIFANEGFDQSPIYRSGFPRNQGRAMLGLFSDYEMQYWEDQAISLRPDLKSKGYEVKIAETNIMKEQGTYLPSVWLEANYGGYPTRMLENPSSSFFNQKMNWGVGVGLEWLLFDGCGRAYRVNQARYEKNARECEYQKGIQTTFEEVRKQLFNIEESVSTFLTSQGNVKLAEQTRELADKQLEIGTITIFDYQFVVDGLIQSLNTQNRAAFDLMSGYYGLRHASGIDLICRDKL